MSCSNRLKSRAESRVTTVLVVDRDNMQLDSICRGVFLYGHRCIKLTSVDEALDFLRSCDSPPIDILITDVGNGGSEGIELVEQVRIRNPRLPVIAVCGLASSDKLESMRAEGVLILRRPFHPQGLDEAIRDSVA